jgi:hypothetical protein
MMRVESEVCELWGDVVALGVLACAVALSFWVKTRIPADLCFSEGVAGAVTQLAEEELKIEGRGCCWAGLSARSMGELSAEASTDLEDEWAEWEM